MYPRKIYKKTCCTTAKLQLLSADTLIRFVTQKRLFWRGSDTKSDVIFSELKELFTKHLIPIRPDRKYDRHKDKYRNRQKPKVPKNMKDIL